MDEWVLLSFASLPVYSRIKAANDWRYLAEELDRREKELKNEKDMARAARLRIVIEDLRFSVQRGAIFHGNGK